jgi:formylglycine-generating enzyme required for sulfatase activity
VRKMLLLVGFIALLAGCGAPEGPPPDASLGDTWTRPTDGKLMVFVPTGDFEMGSTDAYIDAVMEEFPDYHRSHLSSRAQPAHVVHLDGFWIDQTEVANAEFVAFLKEGADRYEGRDPLVALGDTDWRIDRQNGKYYVRLGYEDHPAYQVSWYGAAEYCKWVGGRLPTEAEWEYAARGPEGFIYPWGDTFDGTLLNYCDVNCDSIYQDPRYDDGYETTAPVGSFPEGASWCGALDMLGNVAEWVSDMYAEDYYARSPSENPPGPDPEGLHEHVVRGGSWHSEDPNSAFRHMSSPRSMFSWTGFRCVIPAGE